MNLRSYRIACLQKAAKDAKNHASLPQAVGGAGTIAALIAWKLFGYEFVLMFAAAVVFNIIAFVYSFGVRHGAAYIPSEDDVYDELQKLIEQPEVTR